MRESDLLKLIYRRSTDLGPRVLIGPGEDAAMVTAGRDGRVLITVDQLIEGRHFAGPITSEEMIDGIARKSVGRSVSDIAAMAGTPAWGLATAALPAGFPQELADRLFERMSHWARHWGCPLAGGDIASLAGEGQLMLTVTVGGDPHALRGPVLRSGAHPGDQVWVTGLIGGSLVSGRHMSFEPRVAEAKWLADTLGDRLRAMIDVSDGLGIDAGRIAEASGVQIEIDAARVPRHPDASGTTFSDGEDYELLFTTSGGTNLPAKCPASGTQITQIGSAKAGIGCFIEYPAGKRIDASTLGWDH